MGHIVNSISTRLGWFETWKDDIYLDFKHQCDYVHHFIRIRFLLVFMFFAKVPWDEYMMIFSHFEFAKKKKSNICNNFCIFRKNINVWCRFRNIS